MAGLKGGLKGGIIVGKVVGIVAVGIGAFYNMADSEADSSDSGGIVIRCDDEQSGQYDKLG
jgi:hypothetical protein